METTSYSITFNVNQTPAEVFDAICNVAAWWQGEIKGVANEINDVFEYRMPGIHYSKQKLVELVPGEKIVWLVTESNLSSFTKKEEWNGTKIIFEISGVNNQTQMRFTHSGLVATFQCYGDCAGAWGLLVGESLLSLITTGKGKKVF